MSRRKVLWALGMFATILLVAPKALWAQGGYLDDFIVKVKPDKVADFEAIAKKIADANRHANGDRWLAIETVYGESNTYVFTSRRENYADIDKASDMFINAMNKAFGKEAAARVFQDFNNCLISGRTELRARRPDLSSKMPADAQALNKLVGESRVLRTMAIHIRPGHAAEFEALMKEINSHADNNPNTQPVLVSEVIEGGRGDTFYITFFRSSLGGFDRNPDLKDIVGEEDMAKIEKTFAEIAAGSESAIYRFSPELSNPPDEITQVAADFWQPKPAMASMSRPKPKTTSPMAEATPTTKPNQKQKP
jgi:quinol monooxygenase YgiN